MEEIQIPQSTIPPQASTPPVMEKEKKKGYFVPLLIIIGIILIGGVGLLQFSLPQFTSNTKKNTITPTSTAKLLGAGLVIFEGEVEYKTGNDGWKNPTYETVLNEGDMIRVLSTGRAVINFDDGSIIRLNANTTVKLVNLKPDSIEVANEKGELYSRVVKSKRTFTISDGTVKYQSLGTAYKTINSENKKGVEVYESKVKVSGENKKEIVVEEGSKYILGTKVEKIAMTDLNKDEFAKWNKTEDEKFNEFKNDLGVLEKINEPTPTKLPPTPIKATQAPVQSTKLLLSAQKTDSGVNFYWSVEGISVTQGFKIIKSESPDPVYPGNDFQYVSDSNARQYSWGITDGKTYHFRICVYHDGGCKMYSNDITSATPTKTSQPSTESKVNSINLTSHGGAIVKWTVDGYSAKGYKVVWSQNTDPVYPSRSGDTAMYISNPDTKDATINAFSGTGKYYVRVCEYLGGSCGVYSNQIDINL